jgi:spore coat polysaccharide biosynthesis predicted glycosyltransferase SpsG
MGAHAPWLSDVQKRAAHQRCRTHVIVNANNMGELMAQSDLAIGAAGSTAWERCCLGLPTLMVVLADNQRTAAVSLEKVEAAWLLELNESLPNQLQSQIELLQANKHQALAIMSRQAAAITDGLGADRVLDVIQEVERESLQ